MATSSRGQTEVRSDAAVFADARRRLDDSPAVPGTVRIHVDSDLVTLTGSVHHLSQRAEAERVVQPLIGSRRLINHIVVMNGSDAEMFDTLDE